MSPDVNVLAVALLQIFAALAIGAVVGVCLARKMRKREGNRISEPLETCEEQAQMREAAE